MSRMRFSAGIKMLRNEMEGSDSKSAELASHMSTFELERLHLERMKIQALLLVDELMFEEGEEQT